MAILKGTLVRCAIVDASLPSTTDGSQLAEKLHDDPCHCRTPVVFLTARTLPAAVRRGREPGAGKYITKPFSLQQVLEEVARLVAP